MNFISEYVDDKFAFISIILSSGERKVWKIDKDSKSLEDFIDFIKIYKEDEWFTLNGVPVSKCLVQVYDKVKTIFKEEEELRIVQQLLYRTKNNDGRAFTKQFNLTDLTGKDLNLAKIMKLQENNKLGYYTEVEYLEQVYPFYKDDIDLRYELAYKYEINTYESKYKIIHSVFDKLLKKEKEEREKDWDIKDILLKYEFQNKELTSLLNKVSNLSVKNDDTSDLINETIKCKGLDIKVGMGGLHGSKTGDFESNEKDVIVYYDVNSFYPSIIVNQKLSPIGLTNFKEIYKEFYDLKKNGDKKYKDLINFIYGFSNHKPSIFYDPKFNTTITLNGEIMMLELLFGLSEVNTFVPLIVNTDGFYAIVSREELNDVEMKIAGWSTIYNLELKSETVDKLSIKDGNNYFKIGQIGKYPHPLTIDGQELASYDGTGMFNPILFTNNPLKSLKMKEEIKNQLYKWLVE